MSYNRRICMKFQVRKNECTCKAAIGWVAYQTVSHSSALNLWPTGIMPMHVDNTATIRRCMCRFTAWKHRNVAKTENRQCSRAINISILYALQHFLQRKRLQLHHAMQFILFRKVNCIDASLWQLYLASNLIPITFRFHIKLQNKFVQHTARMAIMAQRTLLRLIVFSFELLTFSPIILSVHVSCHIVGSLSMRKTTLLASLTRKCRVSC